MVLNQSRIWLYSSKERQARKYEEPDGTSVVWTRRGERNSLFRDPGIDVVNGLTSRVTPRCFRRAWATNALNDEKNPTPIDVVSEVLRHKEIATTRRHYAPTKSDRARAALIGMKVG